MKLVENFDYVIVCINYILKYLTLKLVSLLDANFYFLEFCNKIINNNKSIGN